VSRFLPASLPALLAALASLAVPFLGGDEQGVAVSAGSVTAKAAQHVEQPADQRFPVGGPLFAEAQRIAAAHWGVTACNGAVAVSWQPLEAGTNATATWRNPTDAWNNPGENFDCSVVMSTYAEYDFAKLCTVLAHELGHLVGRQHAAVDGDLMSPLYSAPLPACAQAAPDAPAAEEELVFEDEAADADADAAADRTAPRKPRKASSKRALGRTKTSRCVRRFSDGRKGKSKRCVKAKKAKRSRRTSRR